MNLGTVYINVHTTNNGGGEIRAQLRQPVGKLLFDARLDAAQEVPPTASPAQGSATVWLNTTFDTLWYEVVAHGLTGPITAAHFHNAPPGMSGGVILGMNGISGSRVSGMAAGANLTGEFIAKLLRGETYINLHTAMFPGGEIRGQVYRLAREGYTFQMNGGQEVPANNSAAYGSGVVSIDRDQTNAHYMVVYDGLTATAGHFHKAVAGTNGGVIFPLDLANNSAFGYWDATDAPPFTLANSIQFRNDSVYVNIHSAAFPGGEIRGQVERGFVCFAQTSGVEALPPFLSGFELFPNPVADQLVLRLSSERPETVLITLTDAMGRVSRSFRQDLLAGQQDYPLNLGELPGGFYSISLRQGGEVATRKFFKE
jgi:hypothetical protein